MLDQACPKGVILVKIGKSEHHHWIRHIRISLDTKFQLSFDFFCRPNLLKREFPVENRKIALVRSSMVVTYYIKLFRKGTNRYNGILMSLLLLVTEKNRLRKEVNKLFIKGMSNIYLKVTIEKNWHSQNLHFLSLKDLSPSQFLGSFNIRSYHGILKLLVAT